MAKQISKPNRYERVSLMKCVRLGVKYVFTNTRIMRLAFFVYSNYSHSWQLMATLAHFKSAQSNLFSGPTLVDASVRFRCD